MSECAGQAPASTGRVWVVSEVYWPEETATGFYLNRIAEALAADHPVGVLCGQPKYDRRGLRVPRREERHGTTIVRCPGTTLDKNVLAFRLVNTATITLSMFVRFLAVFRRGDVVIVATNPPALPFFAVLACRLRGAACVLLLHDVYPDALVVAGMVPRDTLPARALERLNRWLYRSVQRIVVLGRDMAVLARRRLGGSPDDRRVVVIANWADHEEVVPGDRASNPLLTELGLARRFVVLYAGNMGPLHGIGTIVAAARVLGVADPGIHFLFIGTGARRPWLESVVRAESLRNVTVIAPRPRSDQQVFLNACDVAVSAFVPGMLGVGVPSRMYNVMAAGKAMIAAVDEGSEQALAIRELGIGWVVAPEDVGGMVTAIRSAKADPEGLAQMGRRARSAAETAYSEAVAVRAYREVVAAVLR